MGQVIIYCRYCDVPVPIEYREPSPAMPAGHYFVGTCKAHAALISGEGVAEALGALVQGEK